MLRGFSTFQIFNFSTGVGFGPCLVVVVDADGVVATADKAVNEAVGKVVVEIVGREAEVDAIEALPDAWEAFKLEMPAYGLQPAVLPGGGSKLSPCKKATFASKSTNLRGNCWE